MIIALVCGVRSRLVFPPGSDVGYILPDPEDVASQAASLEVPHADLKESQIVLHSRKTRGDPGSSLASIYADRWYPHSILDPAENFLLSEDSSKMVPESLVDAQHGIKMGVKDEHCDDGKTHLEVDWDFSPANYTCYTPRFSLPSPADAEAASLLSCEDIKKSYSPQHFCMTDKIEYESRIPSYGDHRPIWPVFGEYKFVPPQRWLHNIEHGAVVMLYHPCARPQLVAELRALVTQCTYKHIITPYTPLTVTRPLALVAWGCTLEMAHVEGSEVRQFIQQHSLQGPEGTLRKQGQFTEGLLKASVVPEGYTDEGLVLCPQNEI
ncbi:Protein of unknown function DUF3105 [Trinorchestia longiramus]|nr:Protein of unknown function DUF3105 [Trinorchestia longiramus]